MSFEDYLKEVELSTSTIDRYLSFEKEFCRYFSNEDIKSLSYTDLLGYIESKERKGIKRSTLIHELNRTLL